MIVEIIELHLIADEEIAPVVGNAESQVNVQLEHAVVNFGACLPNVIVGVDHLFTVYSKRFVSLPIGPGLRLVVPFSIVVGRLFIKQYVIIGVVLVDFHTVIDADGRHGHGVDDKSTAWHEIVAIAKAEVGLSHIDAPWNSRNQTDTRWHRQAAIPQSGAE